MSDAHANPVALDTALKDARALGCEKFLFLGDITGYGYDAKKTLAMVRGNFNVVLLGNHDSACLGREVSIYDRMNHNYDLDRQQHDILSPSERKWLGARKFFKKVDGMALAHGDFTNPECWNYILGGQDALANFGARQERLMFCGHTHHVAVWKASKVGNVTCPSDKRIRCPASKPESIVFKRAKGARYIVNVGSVGYPRSDLFATYVVCDPSSDSFTVRCLPFDFKSYVSEMLARGIGLPAWLYRILVAAGKGA